MATPSIPSYLEEAAEEIDAAIFSGDDFIDRPERILWLRERMARWERGLATAITEPES